jgi:hypothetical protein
MWLYGMSGYVVGGLWDGSKKYGVLVCFFLIPICIYFALVPLEANHPCLYVRFSLIFAWAIVGKTSKHLDRNLRNFRDCRDSCAPWT